MPNNTVHAALDDCRRDLHAWGQANQVTFDPAKESMHIISRRTAYGNNFTILGIEFDNKLVMRDAVHLCAIEAGWRIKSILRPRRYFKDTELVSLYKTHALSHIEYRTPGVAHASVSILSEIDRLQTRFLRDIGISELEGLMVFNLAPLATRRHIALLGVIHRCVLEKGPPHFQSFFPRVEVHSYYQTRISEHFHGRRIAEFQATHQPELFRRSLFGAAPIYNILPPWVVFAGSVSVFQKRLQRLVRIRAEAGREDWQRTLCWDQSFNRHPLNSDRTLLIA